MKVFLGFLLSCFLSSLAFADKPNVVIVMTDEHNLRTLGCYREQMTEDQAFVWGKGVKVDTPHIDSLARGGALLSNFYVASPSCSPSRATFMTGLYPHKTGVPNNDLPMDDSMVTFAEVLADNGYATGYLGKWHLDGKGKPQWGPERKFGWNDNRYMFNRGHYKKLIDTDGGPKVDAPIKSDGIPGYDVGDADETTYATDFLMDRTLDFIRDNKDGPFCVMLSLPDPHGPNTVREPYHSRFMGLEFQTPKTMRKTAEQTPAWTEMGGNNYIKEPKLNPSQMAAIFGMVQCIDDNIGELLETLSELGIRENTVVLFTSDHGDLMGEHRRHNKGVPFEMSVKSAFIINYPGNIPSGKVVEGTMTSADVGPTLLSLVGVKDKLPNAHGRSFSKRLLNKNLNPKSDAISYFRGSTNHPSWVASVSSGYKLIISDIDNPWLFDLEKDPDELNNVYDDPAYKAVRIKHTAALKRWLIKTEDPAFEIEGFAKWL